MNSKYERILYLTTGNQGLFSTMLRDMKLRNLN